MTSITTEPYADLRERLQAARQEAVGRRRSNVLVETKDLSTLLDRCIALEGAVERAFREGYDDGWCTGTAAMQEDREWSADEDWLRSEARTTLTGEGAMSRDMASVVEIIARWDANEGKPYKGGLIDWSAYESDPTNIGCMCAQGQVLHLVAGWSPDKLRNARQSEADRETAKLLNISIAHSILLRSINDNADGAPSVVLTNPEKVIGDQAHIVLAFWLHLDGISDGDWKGVIAAGDATEARAAAGATVGAAAAGAAAAWAAAWAAARDATWAAAGDAAWIAAGAAVGASSEIQSAKLMRERGRPFFFLPMFGFADPEAIPALPANYGVEGVPAGPKMEVVMRSEAFPSTTDTGTGLPLTNAPKGDDR